MFQRQFFQDSYTLDNYIHFIKKKNLNQQQEQQENIKCIEYFTKKPIRKNSIQLSIFSWLVKGKKSQTSLLVSLDKQLILKIYSYLRLTEVVKISQVCQYFSSCYKSLWIDKNFFEQFQTDKFTSEQLNKVIQKSKLNHIKQLRQLYLGKNIKKNRQKIKMKVTDDNQGILQLFSISPKIKNGIVFIMDLHLNNIINFSFKGLKCIDLNRCAYIKDIQNVSKCLQLQKFVISYNENLTTQSFRNIFKRCLKLESLQISECKNVDQKIFNQIKKVSTLKLFTLKSFKQSFGNLHNLSYNQKLEYLNIDDSLINDQQFMNGLRQLKKLKTLSIQGCALLTNISSQFLQNYLNKQDCKLVNIFISRMNNIQLRNIQKIQEKIYQNNLNKDLKQ